MNCPEYVKKALDIISESGHEAFIVGGALRDMMLLRETHDYDIATSALPEETVEIFSDHQVIKTGLKHGTVTVIIDKTPVEITTYRVDGNYKDSRHPEQVSFARRIEDDLSRRDFTVNAMAYNGSRGVVDLFGGKEDLYAKMIRAVGNPKERFEEDALRILRAFRFASKLEFDIEEKTLLAAKECREGLFNISAERKSVELEGILLGKGVEKSLFLMKKSGVLEVLLGGITLSDREISLVSALPYDFACRLAFCLIGKNGADELVSSMKLSNALSSKVRKLKKFCEERLEVENDFKLRKLMAAAGDDLMMLIEMKKVMGEDFSGVFERAEKIRKRGDCLFIKDLAVNGKDLAELGICGKDIGNALESLLEYVYENPQDNTKKVLMEKAKRFVSKQ